MEEQKKTRRSLVMLFGIGFVPLIIAWLVYFYVPALMPETTTNEGELIMPPHQAEALGLNAALGKWSLIVPVEAVCNEVCEERLYLARQVNVALGKESERVQRVLLPLGTPDMEQARLKGLYPDMLTVLGDQAKLREVLETQDVIYLMDPIGNIFMVYRKEKAGKPMLKDIKHLLKISNIG